MADNSQKPGLDELMKKAKEMQQHMQHAQEELANMEIHGEAGGGLVKVLLNGRHDVKQVIIEDSALDEGKDVLEDLIAAAFNSAVRKIEEASKKKVIDLTKTIGMPPGFELPKKDEE